MAEDQATKDTAKEQVLEAIQTLRAKGAEINPYTVATEGGLPRSTIYRNAELMELISREKAEPAEKLAAKDAGFPDRVTELEAEVEQLGQTIWNLEKQNEDLQKDFSDAWTMGFAAGVEEANKRFARGITPDSAPQAPVTSAWPSVDRNAASEADKEDLKHKNEPIIMPSPVGDFSGMPDEKDVPPHTAPVISPVSLPQQPASPLAETPAPASFKRGIDQAESGTFNAAAAPVKTSQVMNAIIDFSTAAEAAADFGATAPRVDAGKKAGSSNTGVSSSSSNDKVIMSDPVEDEFAYFGEEVVLSDEYLYSPELLKEAESILFGTGVAPVGESAAASNPGARKGDAPQTQTASQSSESTAANYSLDFAQTGSGGFHTGASAAGVESGFNIGTVNAVGAQVIEGRKTTPAADVFAAQHTYDAASGIYNVARSGPYVASEFNPLIELSWKDIEDVYNYRASTLKDYARNVPSAPNKLGAVADHPGTNGGSDKAGEFGEANNLVDANILAMLPTDEELGRVQQLETAVYMSEEVTDIVPETGFGLSNNQDPDATGDRMQAMVGYRPEVHPNRLNSSARATGNHPAAGAPQPNQPPVDSEGIVDLDAIDIFDNLDEWIDIDRLERGEDPFGKSSEPSPAVAAQNIKKDELSELIKRRIEQAAEMAPDAAAQSRGLGAGKPATHPGPQVAEPAAESGEAAQPRARNKFIGGKASTDAAAPGPAMPFVKAIPADIRKACLILGVRSEEMTQAMVVEAWKRQIVDVHPDLGGDTETAIVLNTAKDTLVHWIEAQAPKLGKKWGAQANPAPGSKDKDKDKG